MNLLIQEQKDLLLKDLSARLPYKVYVQIPDEYGGYLGIVSFSIFVIVIILFLLFVGAVGYMIGDTINEVYKDYKG